MVRRIDHAALMAFVDKRRKDTGGFGATPRLPATVEDTFQALAITLVLGEEPQSPQPDSALAGYLTRVLAAPWLGIGTTFRLLTSCRLRGIAVDPDRVRAHLTAWLKRDASLAATYYTTRIAEDFLGPGHGFPGEERPVALPGRCAVQDAARYLALKAMTGQRPEKTEELIGWLQASQNGDGGFGFFPGSTSFIENCHAALAALRIIGARVLDPINAKAFVLGCQTRGGGFARSPGAAPFLDASWHGVASLCLLEEMERPEAGGPGIASLGQSLILAV